MNSKEFKLALIEALRGRGVYFEQKTPIMYQTRCPSCGDTDKRLDTGHLYIWINPDDNSSVYFYCHRCPYRKTMTTEDLEIFGIETDELMSGLRVLNKNATKADFKNVSGRKDRVYALSVPDIDESNPAEMQKIDYINHRLGINLNAEEAKKIKVITNFRKFIMDNKIEKLTCKPWMARILHDEYVGFLSSRGSHILFRDITGKRELRWYKYNIFGEVDQEGSSSKNFYAIPSKIDLLSPEPITINLAEGVMDILSVVYNLGYNPDESLNFAVGGKYYSQMILALINMGIVGDNITVNIFADSDNTKDTSPTYYAQQLQKYKPVFKSLNIYYNRKTKDVGVPRDLISLNHYKI